jgi:hypothetical protein
MHLEVAEVVRGQIAHGTLKPGQLAPARPLFTVPPDTPWGLP